MNITLPATIKELARWRDAGLKLPVWWRDDDAVEPSAPLDRLLALAERFEAPIHLAVIPRHASHELRDRLQIAPGVFVLPHGWRHENHAPPEAKKAEFEAHRPASDMVREVSAGRRRLEDLFPDHFLPIFTPPWNRISPEMIEALAAVGFRAISTFTRRQQKFAAGGLLQVNTHLDPIAWKSGGGLRPPLQLDVQLAEDLAARRIGHADNEEPYGLLTHHLVHDDAIWAFVETLLHTFAESGVARWSSPLHELR